MFLAVSNGEREVGGIYEVRIARDQEGRVVMYRKLHNRRSAGSAESTVLLRGVAQLLFSYAGCSSERNSWLDT